MGIKTGIKADRGELTATMADNLERAKEDLEMTYRDMAKLSGVSLKGIYNICEASQSPTVQTLEKICKSMRISMNALLTPNASLDLEVETGGAGQCIQAPARVWHVERALLALGTQDGSSGHESGLASG